MGDYLIELFQTSVFVFIYRDLPNLYFEFTCRARVLPFHIVTRRHKRARELSCISLDLDDNAHVSFKPEHLN
jgi:hypothetical protein